MSKSSDTSSSTSSAKSSLQSQRPGLRQIRSSTAAQAFSDVRIKQTLAPSSTITRRTKIQSDVTDSTKNGALKSSEASTNTKGSSNFL